MSAPIRYNPTTGNDDPFKWDSNVIDFKGYNGSPNLKKSGVQVNFTQEMIDEWKKCKADPVYFAEKYIKIVHVDRGLIPIELYDYQKEIIDKFNNNRNTIVCTARQSGKCVTGDAKVKVRNKKTGEEMEMTIGEFYELNKPQ